MQIAPLAHAQTGDFTIYPTYMHGENSGWIIRELNQGEKTTEHITVENLTNQEITLEIQFREATEEDDGTFFTIEKEPYQNLGLWTDPKHTTVTLSPYEKRDLPIEISIPKTAERKQYTGSILASKTEKNSQAINITTRIGVRTYITVNSFNPYQANVLNSPIYISTYFFILSLFGIIGSLLYTLIQHIEHKKHEKKHA